MRENLKIYFSAVCSLLVFLMVITGCATGGRVYRESISPVNIIPADAFLYIRSGQTFFNNPALNAEIERLTQDYGIPDYFREKTETVSLVFIDEGLEYITAEGSYPDSFIKKRLDQSSDWIKSEYRKAGYYYSADSGIILIPYKNNCLIASRRTSSGTADTAALRAEKIIAILKSDRNSAYIPSGNSALYLRAEKKGNSLSAFLPAGINADSIELIDLDFIIDPLIAGKSDINGTFTITDEKKALIFSSMFRLFLTNYYRKEGIADLKTMLEKNSINNDGRKVLISITDFPLEKLGSLIHYGK
ncbi:MAG: hypothetical protein H7A26_00565 [Spirochaetales bacterium]|nr:hypothetical protein [Spirochaetales bacterium]